VATRIQKIGKYILLYFHISTIQNNLGTINYHGFSKRASVLLRPATNNDKPPLPVVQHLRSSSLTSQRSGAARTKLTTQQHSTSATIGSCHKLSFMLFFSLFLLNFLTVSCTDSKIFQICSKSLSGHVISIPRNISCTFPKTLSEKPIQLEIQLFVPRQYPKNETAIKCTLKTHKIYSYTNFFGAKSIVLDKT